MVQGGRGEGGQRKPVIEETIKTQKEKQKLTAYFALFFRSSFLGGENYRISFSFPSQ